MSVPAFSCRLYDPTLRTRAARGLVTALSAALLALTFSAPAFAVNTVALGAAEPYSVLAPAVTSNGATAMSENLGSTAQLAGDAPPIVLGQTHIGAEAAAAQADLRIAYGDAVLRPGVPLPVVDLAGATLLPGVYYTTAALGFTAGGTLTLDAGGNADAVFILQIGGALSIGASTHVVLVNGADPCNVFWAVNGSTTIGATSRFAGTVMTDVGVTVGAGSRVDGRLMADTAGVTMASTAIRTACRGVVVVPGPAGPAGADGAGSRVSRVFRVTRGLPVLPVPSAQQAPPAPPGSWAPPVSQARSGPPAPPAPPAPPGSSAPPA